MWGKIAGGFFGFMLASPFGLGFFGLLGGILLGHRLDQSFARLMQEVLNGGGFSHIGINGFGFYGGNTEHVQQAFFRTTFLVMGHIAKSDGRVSEREVQAARAVMDQMQLSADLRKKAISYFTEGKQTAFDLQDSLANFRRLCSGRVMLLHMFIEIQVQSAYADGYLADSKRQRLKMVCEGLGLHTDVFESANSRFGAEQHYSYQHRHQYQQRGGHQRYQQSAYTNKQSLQEAYQVLGVSSSVSHDELKKAYRRLMNQHHPDKLIAKGLPKSMIKMATEKTQTIKAAYEQIRASRATS